ncbi:hypothetical protein H7I94_12650 [Mycobacterium szulgai]|nr:hypothetical protein [Mycobacterium szulgai]
MNFADQRLRPGAQARGELPEARTARSVSAVIAQGHSAGHDAHFGAVLLTQVLRHLYCLPAPVLGEKTVRRVPEPVTHDVDEAVAVDGSSWSRWATTADIR